MTEIAATQLAALEANPDGRQALAGRLATGPDWRLRYIDAIRDLDEQALGHRLATIQLLQARSVPFNALEQAVLVRGLADAGKLAEAWQLWQGFARTWPVADAESEADDAAFVILARRQSLPAWQRTPFEWRIGKDPRFTGDARENGVALTWNGAGQPIFLSKRISTAGRNVRVTVRLTHHISTPDERVTLSVRLTCPNARPVPVPMIPIGPGTLTGATQSPALCAFPFVELAGASQDIPRTTRLSIHHVSTEAVMPAPAQTSVSKASHANPGSRENGHAPTLMSLKLSHASAMGVDRESATKNLPTRSQITMGSPAMTRHADFTAIHLWTALAGGSA